MIETPISGILIFRRGLYYLKLIKVQVVWSSSTYEGFFCLQIKTNKLKNISISPSENKVVIPTYIVR